MAFNAGTVVGTLRLSVDKFRAGVKTARTALKGLSKTTKQGEKANRSFASTLALIRDAVIVLPALFRAASAPLRGLIGFLKESSTAAASFEKTVRKLSVSLALGGVQNVKSFTKELEAFASGLQDVTEFSDETVLEVAQILTVLGLTEDKLKSGVTAVLNYAAAMGVDARQGAINFGKTLGGVVGELGEAFPAVKELTIEMLKNAEAFDLANAAMGGFAEAVATTTQGLRAQLINAIGDLRKSIGFAINPVFDVITKAAIKAVKQITSTVQGSEGTITDAFAKAAQGALSGVERVLSAALDLPAFVLRVRGFIAQVSASIAEGSSSARISLKEFTVSAREDLLALAQAASTLPDFLGGAGFAQAAETLRAGLESASVEAAALRAETAATVKKFEDQATALAEAAVEAEKTAQSIRDGGKATTFVGKAFQVAVGFINDARKGLDEINDTTKDIGIKTQTNNAGLSKRLKLLREVNGVTFEARSRAEVLADETANAAVQAANLADQANNAAAGFERAASAASSTASAVGSAASAAAGLTGGQSAGRGGSRGLNLSDPFSAIAALSEQSRLLQGVGAGFVQRAQRGVVEGIRSAVQSQVDNAFREFTNQIVSDLNRRGVFDATERSRIVEQRIAEAVRLGTLPPRDAAQTGFSSFAF